MKTAVLTSQLEERFRPYAAGFTFALDPNDLNDHHNGGAAPLWLCEAYTESGASLREAVILKGLGRAYGVVLTTHKDKTPLLFVKELNDEHVAAVKDKVTHSKHGARLT